MEAIDNRKGNIQFRLQEMELIYEQTEGKNDVPHRHDYFTVLIIESAKGTHVVDYSEFPFEANEVHFVSPGQVHQVMLSEKPKGIVLTFSKEFLIENNISVSFISNINLFQSFGNSPPLKLDLKTFEKLNNILFEMSTCLSIDIDYGNKAVGALLQLFLIYCSNSTKLDKAQINEESAGICILRDFKQLVEEKFKHWHKVKDYAAHLHVSPKHLSQTVKNLTGKVAKDHIQDRIILEAKRLLLHTQLSIKEIAYNTGFEEPLHFSSFFKKNTGMSPSQFRVS